MMVIWGGSALRREDGSEEECQTRTWSQLQTGVCLVPHSTREHKSHLKARRCSFLSHVNQSVTSGCLSSRPPRGRKEGTVPWITMLPRLRKVPGERAGGSHEESPLLPTPHELMTGDNWPRERDLGRVSTCSPYRLCSPAFAHHMVYKRHLRNNERITNPKHT